MFLNGNSTGSDAQYFLNNKSKVNTLYDYILFNNLQRTCLHFIATLIKNNEKMGTLI
jgi:hypothetical protein